MPTPRSRLVDASKTLWYHCISRCVRRAFLCGEGREHRKQWIEHRLRELVDVFAVQCGGFSIMDNHLHLLLRLDPERASGWSAEEVARRWLGLFPLRDVSGNAIALTDARVARFAADEGWVAEIRRRLGDLGWFMKSLKEPLARIANHEDGCSGAFWEARYKSIAVMDEESLLATAAYIDLNPVAAGIAPLPKSRLTRHCGRESPIARPTEPPNHCADDLALLTRNSAQEAGLWLLPVDDDRAHGGERAGLYEGLTLSCYLRIIDASSRMIRAGKTSLEADMAPIFQRLGLDQDLLESTVAGLFETRQRVSNRLGSKQQPVRADQDPSRGRARGKPPFGPLQRAG